MFHQKVYKHTDSSVEKEKGIIKKNLGLEQKFFILTKLKSSNKYEDVPKAAENLGNLEEQVKKCTAQEKLGKQKFHYDAKKLFTPITKANEDTSRKISGEG